MSDWNSLQYLKFSSERTQPAVDLANRVWALCSWAIHSQEICSQESCSQEIHSQDSCLQNFYSQKIVDIGCGPGNSTRVLKDRFANAEILGVDNSENMIATAKKDNPDLSFQVCDAENDLELLGNDFDVVFSNACIQWIPNHEKLLKNMSKLLKKGGILAIQLPYNMEEPIYKILENIEKSPKWTKKISNARQKHTLTEREYYDILSENFQNFSIWKTTYFHKMSSHDEIIEWYKSTGLRPYLNALLPSEQEEFLAEIKESLKIAYIPQKNQDIIFRFPRLFFTAEK